MIERRTANSGMLSAFAKLTLNMLSCTEKTMRSKRSADTDNSIDKLIVGLISPRLGIIESRLAFHGANLLTNQCNCTTNILFFPTQVRS